MPPVTPPPARARYRDVLGQREFRTLFAAGGLSVTGDQLARIAVALLVFERSGSALAASATYACSYLTWLLGGPVLSALSDRHSWRRLMISVDLVRTLLVIVLVIPGLPLWLVFLVLGGVGLLSPPFEAARSALLADVLEGDAYVVGNALNQTINQAAQVAGFLVGGALVAMVGTEGALLVNAATFGVSALLLAAGVRERGVGPGADLQRGPGVLPGGAEQTAAERGRGRVADGVQDAVETVHVLPDPAVERGEVVRRGDVQLEHRGVPGQPAGHPPGEGQGAPEARQH
ncbi:MAG: transporter, partial [Frankiales bacterium]|nr:transporter [Frankiales bacterium]